MIIAHVCRECGHRAEHPGFCPVDGTRLGPSDDPLLGQEIGRYRLARLLGEGGMGRVYLAVQPAIGSRVAIKILSDQCARSPELLERFFAEARAVNLIRHEHIVSIIDLSRLPDGRPYIVMEFIEGQTLADVIRLGPVPLGGLVHVAGEIFSALAAAHAIGIVHRDLKPDNVLITAEGHAKVLDFGIAKLAPQLQQGLSPRTQTGALLGTPQYMAPEQITGAGNVDARSDLYAAGVMLFEAISGQKPFRGETMYELMRAHLEQPPPPLRALRPDVPPALEQVVHVAMAKAPQQRFPSALEMNQAMQQAALGLPPEQWRPLSTRGRALSAPEGHPSHASRSPLPMQYWATKAAGRSGAESQRTTSRRRRWQVAAALSLVALAAVVGVLVWRRGTPASETVAVASTPAPSPIAAPAPVVAPRPGAGQIVAEVPGGGGAAASATPDAGADSASAPERTTERSRSSGARSSSRDHGATSASAPAASVPPSTPPAPKPGGGPTIVGGGSAADHGVHIGPNVEIGSGVIIGSNPPPKPATPSGKTSAKAPADYNPRRFDPVAYLPKARALAQTLLPDAELTSFSFDPVFSDGRVDLTMEGRDREYEFRSPSLSPAPAGTPRNMPVDRACRVSVEVTPSGLSARVLSSDSCDDRIVRAPRCSFAGVWKHALSAGTPSDYVARIAWLSDQKWFFDTDLAGNGGGVSTIVDRCP